MLAFIFSICSKNYPLSFKGSAKINPYFIAASPSGKKDEEIWTYLTV